MIISERSDLSKDSKWTKQEMTISLCISTVIYPYVFFTGGTGGLAGPLSACGPCALLRDPPTFDELGWFNSAHASIHVTMASPSLVKYGSMADSLSFTASASSK
jgi:hypothetical protein